MRRAALTSNRRRTGQARPDAPGQLAFADADQVRRILEESGWTGTELQPVNAPCAFPETGLVRQFARPGLIDLTAARRTRRRAPHDVRHIHRSGGGFSPPPLGGRRRPGYQRGR